MGDNLICPECGEKVEGIKCKCGWPSHSQCEICLRPEICCDIEDESFCQQHCPRHHNQSGCDHELIMAVNYKAGDVECRKCGKLWVPV